MTKVNKVTKHKVCDKSYNCLEYVSGFVDGDSLTLNSKQCFPS
jgi:hypothetical protein